MDALPSNSSVFYRDSVQDDVFLALEGYRKAPSKKDAVVAKAVVGALVDWYRYRGMEARVDTYKARGIGQSVIMKVPDKRRGALTRHRGRYVRIISLGRNGFATFLRFAPLKLTKAQEEALTPLKS
jgi:hypothetical protein